MLCSTRGTCCLGQQGSPCSQHRPIFYVTHHTGVPAIMGPKGWSQLREILHIAVSGGGRCVVVVLVVAVVASWWRM
eukprot:3986693-Prorocentrum_lima.AAC.1